MKTLCLKAEKVVEKGLLKEEISSQTVKSLKYSWAYALNNLGYVYDNKGDIPEALKYYHKSLKIREEIKDSKGISTSYNNIGMIHFEQQDLDLAIDYFLKSLKIRKENKDLYGVSNSYNNLGLIEYKKRDLPGALEYFEKSLKIRQEIGDKKNAANSYNNIAGIYKKQGELEKALDYYYKSLEIQEELGNIKGIINSLTGAGHIEILLGNTNKAINMGERSLQLSTSNGLADQVKRSSRLLYKGYVNQNKWKLALEMRNLQIRTEDSLKSERAIKSAATQQAQYEYEKQKAIDDAKNEKLLAIEQKEKEKQKIITGATAFGLCLVIIFLIFVFNRLRVTSKQKLLIEEQKENVELAHQEIKDSITYAKRIQSAILPPAKLVNKYLNENFILYKPKDVVAGDFYWMEAKKNLVLFAAADCTGHGVPGAMVSVVCHNALNRAVREYGLTEPGAILNKTREMVVQEFEKSEEDVKDGMDIALCSLEGSKLKYAGAHNPLWIIRNGEIIETKANKQPIGQFDNPEEYTTHNFELQTGDTIYIFSDGYVDQFGGDKGKKFKAKAFRELLLSIQNKSMSEQKNILDESFEAWRGELEQLDDVCVIGVRV